MGTDITPMDWTDDSAQLIDDNFNTEIRDSYMLQLTPSICSVKRTTAQSIGTGTYMSSFTALSFDTVLIDTESPDDPMYASGSPTQIVSPTDGWYDCAAQIQVGDLGSSNLFTAVFRVNGTTDYYGNTYGRSSTMPLNMTLTTLIELSDGDYVEVMVSHDNSSAVQVDTGNTSAILTVARRRGL